MTGGKPLARRLALRALRKGLPRALRVPEMGDTLLGLGLDSLQRADLALALEIGEGDWETAWADVLAGDITLEALLRKAEAMAGGKTPPGRRGR